MEDKKELSPKQKKFCENYIFDYNAAKAARDSGYSEKTAKEQGCQLLRKKYIIDYIKTLGPNHEIKKRKKAKKDKLNDNGYVYLIHCKCTNYYKIGKTKGKPQNRLKSLQTSIPFDLKIVYAIKIDNHSDKETYLHWFYKQSRVRGEWFLFSKEELKEVVKKMKSYE